MNIHKKLDRFAQWTKEKAGANKATTEDEEFKALQQEMNQRHDGMQKLHTSASAYVKHINRRTEGDSRDKMTPVAFLGTAMSRHAQDFEPDSAFGQCLATVGQANERIARTQDSYATSITSVWLESMDRSLAQMKEYQSSRKKLEQRRLAYDTAFLKAQRGKKDDYAAEEEMRIQRVKYEEAADEVSRRMQDIIDSENESINDLYSFLETELNHYERCREILIQAKQCWPVGSTEGMATSNGRRSAPRSRQNTLSRVPTVSTMAEDDILQAPMAPFRAPSRRTSGTSSPRYELANDDFGGMSDRSAPMSRVPTNESVLASRSNLRPVKRPDIFNDDSGSNSSVEAGHSRAASPATTHSNTISAGTSRSGSYSAIDERTRTPKKAAPPPPPSRASKPKPPPPPPMKRNAASSGALLSTGY